MEANCRVQPIPLRGWLIDWFIDSLNHLTMIQCIERFVFVFLFFVGNGCGWIDWETGVVHYIPSFISVLPKWAARGSGWLLITLPRYQQEISEDWVLCRVPLPPTSSLFLPLPLHRDNWAVIGSGNRRYLPDAGALCVSFSCAGFSKPAADDWRVESTPLLFVC